GGADGAEPDDVLRGSVGGHRRGAGRQSGRRPEVHAADGADEPPSAPQPDAAARRRIPAAGGPHRQGLLARHGARGHHPPAGTLPRPHPPCRPGDHGARRGRHRQGADGRGRRTAGDGLGSGHRPHRAGGGVGGGRRRGGRVPSPPPPPPPAGGGKGGGGGGRRRREREGGGGGRG